MIPSLIRKLASTSIDLCRRCGLAMKLLVVEEHANLSAFKMHRIFVISSKSALESQCKALDTSLECESCQVALTLTLWLILRTSKSVTRSPPDNIPLRGFPVCGGSH